MTDQPSHYKMIPSFNTSLIQQQQQLNQAQQAQQQAQQTQFDASQARPNFMKPEQRQMWQMHQLAQQQQQQQQQQFRVQNPGGPDPKQVADFMRNQPLNRPAGSQAGPAAGAPSMPQHSPPNTFGSNPTPSSSLPFGGMPTPNASAEHLNSLANSSQGLMRQQLERLQQHAGQTNKFAHFSPQNGGGNPSGPLMMGVGDMPPNPLSLKQPQQQGSAAGGAQQLMGTGRRPMTLAELNDRARVVREQVSNLESMVLQLSRNQSSGSDQGFSTKMQFLMKEIQTRKEYLNRVSQAATQQFGVGLHDVQPSANMQSNATLGGASNPQNLAATWLKPGDPASATSFGQNNSVAQPGHSAMSAQSDGNHPLQQQQLSTSRILGNTNQGIHNGQSNGTAQVPAMSMDSSSHLGTPTPLEKSRFESAYQNFCKTKNVVLDPRFLMIENRPVDLHALHVQVISEGGFQKISQNDIWPVIGARLGFVQFPGTDNNPAKSGPATAQQLAHIYRQFLFQFDSIYTHSLMESRRKMLLQQQQGEAHPNANGPARAFNAQQMQLLLSYAKQSADQLRAQGVPEKTIQLVESRRAQLQRGAIEQGMFRGQLQNPTGNGAQGSEMPPLGAAASLLLAGNSAQSMQNASGSGAIGPAETRAPPIISANQLKPEHLQLGVKFVSKVEQEFSPQLQQMRPQEVPNESRMEFNTALEQSHRLAGELRNKAPMFFVVAPNEEAIRRLVHIIATVSHQRALLSSNPPRYILTMDMLRRMLLSMQKYNEQFHQIITQISHKQQAQPQHHSTSSTDSHPAVRLPVQTTPQPLPQPTQNPPTPRQPQVAVSVKKPGASPAAATSPTPLASSSTASSQHGNGAAPSPQPPKSPKMKTTPKSGAKKARRPSKAQPISTPTNSAPASSGQNAEEPATAPSPSSSLKRPREEIQTDTTTLGIKRVKTENETSPEVAPESPSGPRKLDTSTIHTEEEATNFFEQMSEQMSELIRLASDSDGQETLSADLSDTLTMILRGCSGEEQDHSGPGSLTSLDFADSIAPSHTSRNNEFPEFLDLSSYGGQEEDDRTKAATPDLVPSSSTNPSPESATSDLEFAAKTEDMSDNLRLGIWKEIDGGESAYYTQQGDWKWDNPMPASEQPWAMFTS